MQLHAFVGFIFVYALSVLDSLQDSVPYKYKRREVFGAACSLGCKSRLAMEYSQALFPFGNRNGDIGANPMHHYAAKGRVHMELNAMILCAQLHRSVP